MSDVGQRENSHETSLGLAGPLEKCCLLVRWAISFYKLHGPGIDGILLHPGTSLLWGSSLFQLFALPSFAFLNKPFHQRKLSREPHSPGGRDIPCSATLSLGILGLELLSFTPILVPHQQGFFTVTEDYS